MREILRIVIVDTVINTILGRLTLDPAGMHCPSWDDVFVSSLLPVLNLLTGQKSGFLPLRDEPLNQLMLSSAGPTDTWVRLAVQNFTSIAKGGGNAAQKY